MTKIADNIGVNRTVMAISVARMGDAVGNSILFIVIPLYVAQVPAPWFPVPESVRIGLLISVYGLVTSLLQPLGGALSDRVSRRKPFVQVGLILMAAATLGFVVASRYTDLLLLRLLQGLGVALTVPASMALIARASARQTRGGSMGVYSTLRMTGLAVGPLVGGFLNERLGFDANFVAGAAFVLLGVILVQLWVREEVPAQVSGRTTLPFQLIDRKLLSGGIIGAAFATLVMANALTMIITLENEFNARLHQTAVGFAVAFSALTISRVLFQIPLGRVSDRLGRKPLIIGGLVVMAASTLPMGGVRTTEELVMLRIVQGIAAAAIAAPAFAVAADLSKAGGEGRQLSIVTMGFTLGIATGPLLAGVLSLSFFELPFIIGGLMALVGGWIVYRYVPETVDRTKRDDSAVEKTG
jgi:MFS family permease